ncbi:MAG: restriction endonuclease subunit S, partial [Candidatus Hadarchaeum sp.]
MPKTLLPHPTERSVPYLLIDGLNNGASLHTEDTDLPMITPEDTVVVADGSRSGLPMRGVSGALGSTLLRYRAKEGFDGDYLYYLLESLYPFTNTATIGGAVPHLDKRLLSQLVLKTPGQAERTIIGAVLRAVDEMLSATNAELLAAQRLKTALMQQLFTKGIPGRHKDFTQIKRGIMPASWQITTISRVADVSSGVTLNQDRSPRSNGYRYLTVVNVQRDYIDLTEERYLELWPSEVPSRLLEKGDILVVEGHANSSEIGRAAMVDEKTKGMTFQNHLFRVRVNTDELIPAFLLYSLNCERVRRHWNAICNTSSGLNTINRRQLRRLEIPKPPHSEQEEIVSLIEASKATVKNCEGKLRSLEKLKKSLLQNLLTGKVRVNM